MFRKIRVVPVVPVVPGNDARKLSCLTKQWFSNDLSPCVKNINNISRNKEKKLAP